MNKKHRAYTQEFKQEALQLLQSSGMSAAALERELGITNGMLLKWRDRYQVKQGESVSSLEPSDMEAAKREIQQLKRELAVVREERDILKKAVNIFSRAGR